MQTDVKEIVLDDVADLESSSIVVYNDDVNSFQHVIACFVAILGHDALQAEQCAWIIHNNGKCSVKSGSFEELIPYCEALLDMQISAKIE